MPDLTNFPTATSARAHLDWIVLPRSPIGYACFITCPPKSQMSFGLRFLVIVGDREHGIVSRRKYLETHPSTYPVAGFRCTYMS